MQLEIIKSKENHYKFISKSNRKHPALIYMAQHLKDLNKICPIKIGLYNISSSKFNTHVSVYSYISDSTEKMNRKAYKKFMNGKKHIKKVEFKKEQNWKEEILLEDLLV